MRGRQRTTCPEPTTTPVPHSTPLTPRQQGILDNDGISIFPLTEAANAKFEMFQSSPRFMNLDGKELLPRKAAEAESARQENQKTAWIATKQATQAHIANENAVTWVVYAELPATLQDKSTHIKETIVKHV